MTTRGPCTDALAIEVYTLTMRRVKRNFGHSPTRSQSVHDAVGEAFSQWLRSASDKAEHAAAEHATWVAKTAATHILDTNPCKRRTARGVRSLASYMPDSSDEPWHDDDREADRFESILRKHRGAADVEACEDNIIEAMDAILASDIPPGTGARAFNAAMIMLKARHWSDRGIGEQIGVAAPTISMWRTGNKAPSMSKRVAIIRLASERRYPASVPRKPATKKNAVSPSERLTA